MNSWPDWLLIGQLEQKAVCDCSFSWKHPIIQLDVDSHWAGWGADNPAETVYSKLPVSEEEKEAHWVGWQLSALVFHTVAFFCSTLTISLSLSLFVCLSSHLIIIIIFLYQLNQFISIFLLLINGYHSTVFLVPTFNIFSPFHSISFLVSLCSWLCASFIAIKIVLVTVKYRLNIGNLSTSYCHLVLKKESS